MGLWRGLRTPPFSTLILIHPGRCCSEPSIDRQTTRPRLSTRLQGMNTDNTSPDNEMDALSAGGLPPRRPLAMSVGGLRPPTPPKQSAFGLHAPHTKASGGAIFIFSAKYMEFSIYLAENINIAPALAFVCGAWRPKADCLGVVGGRSPPTDIARGLGGGSPPAESVRIFCPSTVCNTL